MFTSVKVIITLLPVSLILVLASPVFSENLNFYIVAKNRSDTNFVRTLEGCNAEAEIFGDRCFLFGPHQQAQPFEQYLSLKRILSQSDVNGIAISVMDTRLIRKALASSTKTLPVITFDSPFKTSNTAKAPIEHIGIDDVSLGRKLAKLAMYDKPNGGTICIMTDNDTNLSLRVKGVRLALSAGQTSSKLVGENGWRELDRCPLLASDNADRVSKQLAYTIDVLKPNVILSVGHWPVYFQTVIEPLQKTYLDHLTAGELYLYVAIGNLDAAMSSLLDSGYARGYVEIDFYEQGRLIYSMLSSQSQGYDNRSFLVNNKMLVIHHNVKP